MPTSAMSACGFAGGFTRRIYAHRRIIGLTLKSEGHIKNAVAI